MAGSLEELVTNWVIGGGFDERLVPERAVLESGFPAASEPCRLGADQRAIAAWEDRHGYRLPDGLKRWLRLSNGLYRSGPLIHPIFAIGPMVPFARVPDLIVQPESWFELGNPNEQTICVDLGYQMPGGGNPIFTSGDDSSASPPRVIARSFEEWFLELIRQGGREYWFDPGFVPLGDPWDFHRRHAALPSLPSWLRPFTARVNHLWHDGLDDREIALELGLSRADVESIFRHIQHASPNLMVERATGT